jgi:hypothetical protein
MSTAIIAGCSVAATSVAAIKSPVAGQYRRLPPMAPQASSVCRRKGPQALQTENAVFEH